MLYVVPLATSYFSYRFFTDSPNTKYVYGSTITSPFAAAFAFPLYVDSYTGYAFNWSDNDRAAGWLHWEFGDVAHFGGYVGFTLLFNAILFGLMIWMFNSRWRVSSSEQ